MSPQSTQAKCNEDLQKIASRHLRVRDVTIRNREQIEHHELAVWQLREALEAAWIAGHSHGLGENQPSA